MPIRNDDARRIYFRDYMRKRRAGIKPEPKKPKPEKPEWQPTQRMVDEVGHWFYLQLHRAWDMRGISREVVADLDPNNADGTPNKAAWTEAFRRYKVLRDEQCAKRKAEREEKARREAEWLAERRIKRCSFCNEPRSQDRPLFGDGRLDFICEPCAKRAVAEFAKVRRKKR